MLKSGSCEWDSAPLSRSLKVKPNEVINAFWNNEEILSYLLIRRLAIEEFGGTYPIFGVVPTTLKIRTLVNGFSVALRLRGLISLHVIITDLVRA